MTEFGYALSSEEHSPRALVENARKAEELGFEREAGYTHVYFHQIGPDQDGFFRFWKDELEPSLSR